MSTATSSSDRYARAQRAQDYADDIQMWGHLPATVTVEGTDMEWSAEEFTVALTALRDHYTSAGASSTARGVEEARHERARAIARNLFTDSYLSTIDEPAGLLTMLTDAILAGMAEERGQ